MAEIGLPNPDRAHGAIFGLVLGDVLCAASEGGILERSLWRLLSRARNGRMRWTDDSQMSINIMQSICACGLIDQDHLAKTFAESYRWSRGYGPSAGCMLKQIKRGKSWSDVNCAAFPDGSFGNGAAMRVAPVVLYARLSGVGLNQAITDTAIITHAHPLAIEGARIIAHCIDRALDAERAGDLKDQLLTIATAQAQQAAFLEKIKIAESLPADVTPKQLRARLGSGMSALDSCISAVVIAQHFIDADYMALINYVQKLGGDADTIAAMAGSIWGAANGFNKLPQDALQRVEDFEEIQTLFDQFIKLKFKEENNE